MGFALGSTSVRYFPGQFIGWIRGGPAADVERFYFSIWLIDLGDDFVDV
jgi:hypothetical protein